MMLEIENLKVAYGRNEALHGISVSVEKGQIVSIIGSNGAGKSTLLNAVSAMIKINNGVIKFNGEVLQPKADQIVRKGIVQIPEGRKTFSGLTVEENIRVGAFLNNDKAQIKEMMEEQYITFPILRERKNQYAATLSGGEQQMLAIARGLMSRPQMLLLDEPSLGLAPKIVTNVFSIIKHIAAKGVTVLIVEQNAKKALEIADYAFVIENGRLTKQGTGKELLRDPTIIDAYLGGKKRC
jgi:branched-chain amino acid transport system ATP-binding protein